MKVPVGLKRTGPVVVRPRRLVPPLGLVLEAGEALHRQIAEQLRRAILERRLTPGARLPSSRLMARELACARGTVLAAIDQLVAEGYLVARPASGVSITMDLPDEMLVAPAAPAAADQVGETPILPRRTRVLMQQSGMPLVADDEPPLAFPIGQPDRAAFPFPLWARLLEREWRRPDWAIAGASTLFGHAGLRAAISDYLGTARGFACDKRAIVVTSGVRQSVSLFARIVLEAGEQAWIEEPGYPGMAQALAAAEIQVVPVPVDAAGFSAEVAMSLAPAARLAVVAPSHQFPLGAVMSLQRRLMLLGWAERARGWIIEDDFDGEYRYAGRALAPLRALDRTGRVAYLGSFSKLLFPALRLSYLVLPETLVAAAEQVMAAFSSPAPLLGQGALARFIAEGELAAHLRRTRLLYAGRQRALVEAARRHWAGLLDVAADGGGMHLVGRPVGGFDDQAVVAAAAAAGVRVAPLSVCYDGTPAEQGLLLGYAATPDVEIEPAVARLGEVLRAGLVGREGRPTLQKLSP